MRNLSSYVYEVGDNLFNLTSKKVLPKDSSDIILKENFFLAGQEQECLHDFLFNAQENEYLSIKILPTWECNLRCSHCFVLEKLVKKQNKKINQDELMIFIENYYAKFQKTLKRINISFIGGEAALVADQCNQIAEKVIDFCNQKELKVVFNLTSNGTILSEDFVLLLKKCIRFTISLDGTELYHNKQRKSLDGFDPYQTTVLNLKAMIKLGFRDNLLVQASIPGEEYTETNIKSFLTSMFVVGVKPENIIIGHIAPTKRNNDHLDLTKSHLKDHLFPYPCCKYRFARDFQVDASNCLYADYFEDYKLSFLGRLTDSIDSIMENHIQVIKQNMSILNDPKCQKCDVVGACWGKCCNLKMLKPSDYCDPIEMKNIINKHCKDGNIGVLK